MATNQTAPMEVFINPDWIALVRSAASDDEILKAALCSLVREAIVAATPTIIAGAAR